MRSGVAFMLARLASLEFSEMMVDSFLTSLSTLVRSASFHVPRDSKTLPAIRHSDIDDTSTTCPLVTSLAYSEFLILDLKRFVRIILHDMFRTRYRPAGRRRNMRRRVFKMFREC